MRFAAPITLLYACIGAILLMALYWISYRSYARTCFSFTAAGAGRKMGIGGFLRVKRLSLIMNACAVILIGISLARPQWGVFWSEKEDIGLDIMIALDVSKSMLAADVKPDRITAAKEEVRCLIGLAQGDRIGLMVFSGDAFIQCPLTMDYGTLLIALDVSGVGSVSRGGTNYEAVIDEAVRSFDGSSPEDKVLVILSDGEMTEGGLAKVASRAKERNIKIYAIGIGTAEGDVIPVMLAHGRDFARDREGDIVRTRFNADQLKRLIQETGGAYRVSVSGGTAARSLYKEEFVGSKMLKHRQAFTAGLREQFQVPLFLACVLILMDLTIVSIGRI